MNRKGRAENTVEKMEKGKKIIALICAMLICATLGSESVVAEELVLQQKQTYVTGDVQKCSAVLVPEDVLIEEEPVEQTPDESDVLEESATGKSASAWKKYRSTYTYSKLSSAEKKLYRKLDEQCITALTGKKDYYYYRYSNISYLPCISIGSLSQARARQVFEIFFLSNPQYYFLTNQVLYSNGEAKIAACMSNKYRNGSTRYKTTTKIEKKVKSWDATIAKEKTVIAKEKKAHDIVAKAAVYDTNTMNMMENQQIDSIILTKKSVCAGYSQLFQMLCNKAGIPTICVTSKVHQWNKVKLYGNWYAVDCTWDDLDGQMGKVCMYSYFNRSDKAMRSSSLDQNGSHIEESFWKGISPTAKKDSGGSSSRVPVMSTTTTKSTASSKPAQQKITKLQAGKKQVKICYKQNKNATGYQIMLSKKADFKTSQKVLVKSNKVTEKTIKNLKTKSTYYIRVRSYKTVDKKRVWGKWSVTKKFTVK
ncbi:MAG: transglutaminase domain-containing protein [Lachnospiraceae bacterium]